MAEIKLDYVNTFIDARGKLRHQFRRKGHKKVTIKGRPGSQEFMDAYHALLNQTGGSMVSEIGSGKAKAGSVDATIAKYVASSAFTKGLSTATQVSRRPILDHFRDFKTPSGRRYGDALFSRMKEQDIRAALEGKTYHVQRSWIKAIRALISFAKSQGEISVDVSAGIKALRDGSKSMGYITWKPPQVEQYRNKHPLGTMARLALELTLNIAARRTDIHQIGRQHMSFNPDIQANVLTWRPQKTARSTGKVLSIPVAPFLQEALDAMPDGKDKNVLALLTNDFGKAFASANSFGGKFSSWCIAAGLEPVLCPDGKTKTFRLHGLRKAALYTLYKLGATTAELQAIGGHGSIAELQKYIQEVEQDEQAIGAMAKVIAAQRAQIEKRKA